MSDVVAAALIAAVSSVVGSVLTFIDRNSHPVLLRRQVMAFGQVGRVRDLSWERRHGGTDRFEY